MRGKKKKEDLVTFKISKELAYKFLDAISNIEVAKEFKRIIENKPELVIKDNIAKNKQMQSYAKARRNELIQKQTETEKFFKARLKACEIEYEFQKIIYTSTSFYVADFYIPNKRLVVELDGGYHLTTEQKVKDKFRTKELNTLGYKVIRLTNERSLQLSEAKLKEMFK